MAEGEVLCNLCTRQVRKHLHRVVTIQMRFIQDLHAGIIFNVVFAYKNYLIKYIIADSYLKLGILGGVKKASAGISCFLAASKVLDVLFCLHTLRILDSTRKREASACYGLE